MVLDPSQVWTVSEQRTPSSTGSGAFWGLNAADEAAVMAAVITSDDPGREVSAPWSAAVIRPDGTVAATCSTTWAGGLYWSWDNGPGESRLLMSVSLGPIIAARREPTTLDEDFLRAFALMEPPGRGTPYQQIHRIPAGVTASWASGQRQPRMVDWYAATVRSATPELSGPYSVSQYLATVDSAVDALTAVDTPLAATLSGGLDSTFVVASLARHATADNPMQAFCHSPHPDASLPDQPGWQPDDFPAAQAMVAAYSGRIVLHRVINEDRTTALDAAASFAERTWLPAVNPANQVWIDLIAARAKELGADRLHTGAQGNMVFSVTPTYALEFYRQAHDVRGAAATVAAWREWGESWSGILRRRVMPAMTPDALELVRRWRARGAGAEGQPGATIAEVIGVKDPPPAPQKVFDRELHLRLMLGGSGLASVLGPVPGVPLLVDPFTDRSVVELAARIAPFEWLRGSGPRGFARRAGLGRVPDAVRLRRERGGQAMDLWWSTKSQRDRYVAEVEALAVSPAFAGWIDAKELHRRVERWPWESSIESQGSEEGSLAEIIATNRILSLAAFARTTAERLVRLGRGGVAGDAMPTAVQPVDRESIEVGSAAPRLRANVTVASELRSAGNLAAGSVTIRAMEMADIPLLAALMRQHDSWIGAYKAAPPDSGVGAVQLLTWQLARHLKGVGWYGVMAEDGVLRGQAALIPMPGEVSDQPLLEVVVWVEPGAAGSGLGRFAVGALCEVGFDELGLPAIHSRVHRENTRSLSIFRRAGFRELSVDQGWVRFVLERFSGKD